MEISGAAQRALPGGVQEIMNCVYILKSLKDNKQYIGSTSNLKKRLLAHNKGEVTSTKSRRPFILFGHQVCNTIQEAAVLEKKYKRSHGALERAVKSGKVKIKDGV